MLNDEISSSDTGFIIICAGLVQLMTPGLAFFYGGLVREKNTLTMMSQNFVSLGVTSVLWVIFLFSLCFAEPWGLISGWGRDYQIAIGDSVKNTNITYDLLGDPKSYFCFHDIGIHKPLPRGTSGGASAKIPGLLFAFYQAMFATITPALMTGAFADRLRYRAWLIFLTLWLVLVYAPWCHLIWGGGYFAQQGVSDFAGGIVVHTTAGFSALACCLVLGKRKLAHGHTEDDMNTPHSVPLVFLGTALLWFGWFGFNAGSALASNGVAVVAGWNSQIAAATAMMVWTLFDWIFRGKPGLVGKCVGCIAGLATVTPAAGFIQPWGALALGALSVPVCYSCVIIANALGFDDALDVWGVHGMGGFLGTAMLGLLADGAECGGAEGPYPQHCVNPGTVTRSMDQFKKQVSCASLCAVYSFGVSYVLLRLVGCITQLDTDHVGHHDLDYHEHGETAYHQPKGSAKAREPDMQEPLLVAS